MIRFQYYEILVQSIRTVYLYCQALAPNPYFLNLLGQTPTQSNPVQNPNKSQGDWG